MCLRRKVGKFSGINLFLTRHNNRPAFLSTEKENKKARHIINLYLNLNYIIMTYFNTNENSITNAKIETLVSNNGEKMMSSREIAQLTEKRHLHILRDIRRMLENLEQEKGETKFGFTSSEAPTVQGFKENVYLDVQGKERPEILLNFELTITLISGYNVVLRNRIIKRWQELELQQQQIQLAKQSKQLLALENKLQDAQIKACQFDALVAQSGFLNFRKVAKELELNERHLKSWLIQNDWISLRGSQKKMSPKSWTIRKKYMVFKHQLTESGDISTYPMALFSYKGIKEIQRRLMTLGLQAQRGLF